MVLAVAEILALSGTPGGVTLDTARPDDAATTGASTGDRLQELLHPLAEVLPSGGDQRAADGFLAAGTFVQPLGGGLQDSPMELGIGECPLTHGAAAVGVGTKGGEGGGKRGHSVVSLKVGGVKDSSHSNGGAAAKRFAD
jgi:hypothetical protein